MQTSFLEYAYSVIYSRRFLTPGTAARQRRILYSMEEMGVRPDRSHVKCARVVGQVMGQYHPHGDTASMTRWSAWPSRGPCDCR